MTKDEFRDFAWMLLRLYCWMWLMVVPIGVGLVLGGIGDKEPVPGWTRLLLVGGAIGCEVMWRRDEKRERERKRADA